MVVIHPTDNTTDFLKVIYHKRAVNVFVNEQNTNSEITHILNHMCYDKERVYMLGHGNEYGLLAKTKKQGRLIINSKHVEFLRKLECIGIWCNANMFAEKYNLKGLFSGMIISEMDEAYMFGINTTHEELAEENEKFANRLKYCIQKHPLNEVPIRMLELDDKRSQLTTFNYQNLYWYD
jgi:hypothetical protein